MDDRRVQSTLEKLHHLCEDKLYKIQHLQQQIHEKDQILASFNGQQDQIDDLTQSNLAAAEMQRKLAEVCSTIDIESQEIEEMREIYLKNSEEIEKLTSAARSMKNQCERSLGPLKVSHDILQDFYNSCKENYLMTYEENLTYYWEINNHQACATFADDLTFTELQAQLQKLQQAKEEVKKKLLHY